MLAWLLSAGLLIAASDDPVAADPIDPVAALSEGNRLFRDGRIEEAVSAYRQGYDAEAPHPTLVYNLGTALHHLDRLPEAILWYRRAGDSPDPWLEENLWLARRTLGSQSLPSGSVADLIATKGHGLRLLAALLAWVGLGLMVFARDLRRPAAGLTLLAALVLYSTALVADRLAPNAAVLVEDCSTAAGELPAGTEVWVERRADGDWRINAHSEHAVCPADSVAVI